MKIIDLLNKIANGEEVPKKIKYEDIVFDYTKRNREGLIYIADEYSNYEDKDNYLRTHLFWHIEKLNDEVEIIEEDKDIKKINEMIYKSRCEKAIKYLKNLWSLPTGDFEVATNPEENKCIEIDGNDYIDNLLNILNGCDEDEK